MSNKITVKTTIIMSEEDKKNSDADIPKLNNLPKEQVGAKITGALFHRLCLRKLHQILASGKVIAWPPDFLVQERAPSPNGKKTAPVRRKKK